MKDADYSRAEQELRALLCYLIFAIYYIIYPDWVRGLGLRHTRLNANPACPDAKPWPASYQLRGTDQSASAEKQPVPYL